MNLFPESHNLFPETFYTYGQIPSGLGGAILRQPQTLSGTKEFVQITGGLQPGQTLTDDMLWYFATGGNYFVQPELYASRSLESVLGVPYTYPSLQAARDYWTATALRLTAQLAADQAYDEYIAARNAAAPEIAAVLEFDANGRATDASVEASQAYANALLADELARVNELTEQAVAISEMARQTLIAQQMPAPVRTYTDAELATIVQNELMSKGNTPGGTVNVLVNQYGIDVERGNRIVNSEFSVIAADWQAAQSAAETAAANAAAQAQAQAQAAANAAAQAQAQAQAAAQAEAEAAAMRELEKAQTAAARNFPWFEADMFVNATAQQKAAAYLRYIDMGKSDSEIRSAAQAFFGFQKDADWQLLQEMARQIAIDRAGPIKVTEPPMREEVITQLATQPAGNAGAIALAALAAAILLGA